MDVPGEDVRKKTAEILKTYGKQEAFKYVRECGYGLVPSKELVDSIAREYNCENDRILNCNNEKTFDIDGMDGHVFEHWCADLLRKRGFENVEVTPASNDQGVDILAEKERVRYAIQCKNYATPLGNTPVQEVNSGKTYYKCHIGVVMTNSTFTKGAIALAESTGVLLWDGNEIRKMFNSVNHDIKR